MSGFYEEENAKYEKLAAKLAADPVIREEELNRVRHWVANLEEYAADMRESLRIAEDGGMLALAHLRVRRVCAEE